MKTKATCFCRQLRYVQGVPNLYFQKMKVVEVWGSLAKMAMMECKVTTFVPQAKYKKLHKMRKVCQ